MRRIIMRSGWIYVLVLIQITVAQAENEDTSLGLLDDTSLDLQSRIPEDGRLNFKELAIKYGHKCDEHSVISEDGHILTVFNVKGDKSQTVFLMHGILDSSDTFIIRGNGSLAITLANKGYDVWAGNYRGNKYSRGHLTLDPETDKRTFWNFSQHEFGIYDLPAMVDYVLNETGQTQLQAIAHSQGTTIFYILAAEKPEYNDKIKLLIALAPICYLHNLKGLMPTVIRLWPTLSTALRLTETVQLFSRNSTLVKIIQFICTRRIIGYPICASALFAVSGYDREELEPEFLPILFGHYPDGTAVKNGDHLVQVANKKRFCKFDYGWSRNLREYGSLEPPDYPLENVRMRVALLVGRNDNLSTLEDVKLLRDQLPNVVQYHVMERKLFNHANFVWGRNMDEYLFPMVLDLLKKYQNDTV